MVDRRHHATSEKLFDSEETDFLIAMDAYKRRTGKQFPTLSDTLGVLKSLGYQKRSEPVYDFETALAM